MQVDPTYSIGGTRGVFLRASILFTFEDTADGLAEAERETAFRWEIFLIRKLELNGSGRTRVPWKSQIFNTPSLSQVTMYLSEIILMEIIKETKL